MTDFTHTKTEGFTARTLVPPLRIHLSNFGDLNPADDITPREAVLLCMMLVASISHAWVDYPAFVRENGLERHFTKNDPGQNNP